MYKETSRVVTPLSHTFLYFYTCTQMYMCIYTLILTLTFHTHIVVFHPLHTLLMLSLSLFASSSSPSFFYSLGRSCIAMEELDRALSLLCLGLCLCLSRSSLFVGCLCPPDFSVCLVAFVYRLSVSAVSLHWLSLFTSNLSVQLSSSVRSMGC